MKHLLWIAFLCGCVVGPQQMMALSQGEVCYMAEKGSTQTAADARAELQRRGHTCTSADVRAGAEKIVHGRQPPPGM